MHKPQGLDEPRRRASREGERCSMATPDDFAPVVSGREWIADGSERQLDPRFVPLQQLIGWIMAGVLSIGLLVGSVVLLTPRRWPWSLVLWVLATAIMARGFHRWPAIEYRHTAYRVDADGIEIRRGVYWQTVMNVPRSRVQHTDVVQGPLERKYGLGRLLIYTAGTEHSRVELPGLDHQVALRIRDHLLPRDARGASRGDDARWDESDAV